MQEKIFNNEEEWTGNVYYNKIWEYINDKYLERTKRMLNCDEPPMFIFRDEPQGNEYSKYCIKDLANNTSEFKRIIITKDHSIIRNDQICKTIHVNEISWSEPTIINHLTNIKAFFNLL